MHHLLIRRSLASAAIWISLISTATAAEFEITLDPHVASQPITGRLYVFLTQGPGDPRQGLNWFNPDPFFRIDVKNYQPGAMKSVNDSAAGFPDKLSRIPAGRYRAQAVLAHDIYSCEPGSGAGNFFSRVVEVQLPGEPSYRVPLVLDNVVKREKFPETKWIKEVAIKSDLLSQFHHREVTERAAVVLPAGYFTQPDRRFPVIYVVPWFGGSYLEGLNAFNQPPAADTGDEEFIRVMLDGQCDWGHHAYADSAT
ncbi:MAG TPA: hypothetical protein VGH32_01125, partial [Pirellulales bacterium]